MKWILRLSFLFLLIGSESTLSALNPTLDGHSTHKKNEKINKKIKCESINNNDTESTETCYYHDRNILQTYEEYLSTLKDKDYKNDFTLDIKLGENQQIKNKGNTLSLNYKWKGNNHLSILQEYEGGVTTVLFDYNGKNTKVTTNYSAD
ncbi:hypothetical protein [Obesumbacterium proteus]|uniref:hypothetical protein n=1 Tax=Obesumbacterium proteus TaxID=82983 RepID=UPI00242D7D1B|nr:hypothetical protein [Obesumbacterium proteus]